MMRGGRRVRPGESVHAASGTLQGGSRPVPARFRQVNRTAKYPVRVLARLDKMLEKVRRRVSRLALK